jgi:hypothetical protein
MDINDTGLYHFIRTSMSSVQFGHIAFSIMTQCGNIPAARLIVSERNQTRRRLFGIKIGAIQAAAVESIPDNKCRLEILIFSLFF